MRWLKRFDEKFSTRRLNKEPTTHKGNPDLHQQWNFPKGVLRTASPLEERRFRALTKWVSHLLLALQIGKFELAVIDGSSFEISVPFSSSPRDFWDGNLDQIGQCTFRVVKWKLVFFLLVFIGSREIFKTFNVGLHFKVFRIGNLYECYETPFPITKRTIKRQTLN